MKPIPATDEKELLIKLRDGDERAFELLYQQYSKRIYWKFRRMVKVDEEVEELFQELFIKVWERRAQIDEGQPFAAYLYRIAENMVYDFYRKTYRDQAFHKALIKRSTEYYQHIEENMLQRETSAMIDKAVASLPPQRKQAFVLCKLEEKSYEEAAAIMGISPNTVHNHLVKATKAMKEYVSKHEGYPTSLLLLAIWSSL